MRIMRNLFLLALALGLMACQPQQPNNQLPQELPLTPSPRIPAAEKVRGQVLYVPVYSSILHEDGKVHHLSVQLSVRNISLKAEIVVAYVDYYDTNGKLVRHYVESPFKLNPLETRDFFVKRNDLAGGTGANFVLEWEAKEPAAPPLVEAVMISTTSGLGISFLTQGKEIEHH